MIQLDNVSKVFSLPHERKSTLFHWLTSLGAKSFEFELLYALKNIDLQVRDGEFLGVIGKNGSGKSTLLKVISRVYRPTTGVVRVRGEIFPLLELGVGFQPEFSCKENVYLYGTVLGFTRKQLNGLLPAIIEFAELERFIDAKLGTLSTGMLLRLAFAIAMQSEASIFLVDEGLAVGDRDFWQKCEEQFIKFKTEGKTVVFVSHDMGLVHKFCDRVVVIQDGRIVNRGESKQMIDYYLNEITSARRAEILEHPAVS